MKCNGERGNPFDSILTYLPIFLPSKLDRKGWNGSCCITFFFSPQNNYFIFSPIIKILFHHFIRLEYPNNGVEQLCHSTQFHSTLSYFIPFHSTIYHQSKYIVIEEMNSLRDIIRVGDRLA